MNRTPSAQQTLKRIPTKWAVAIVVALIAYALVQPFANSRWGWNLPSLASVLGMEQPAAKVAPKSVAPKSVAPESVAPTKSRSKVTDDDPTPTNATAGSTVDKSSQKPAEKAAQKSDQTPAEKSTANEPASKSPTKSTTQSTASNSKPSESTSKQPNASSSKSTDAGVSQTDSGNLLYGLLKDAGREVYISPAGLRYTRGSEEGHRLKHIERHLKDIPDRPGKHGVFDGDMAQVLRWIDDAYTRGQRGAKGVRKREEDGRTVYEVPFTKPIGYIGGRDGKRDKNPDAKRLRLVVDGDQVITAFPY